MSFWDIFKTVKKPKKKEREKWLKQVEKAKGQTKANASKSRKSASPKPHKTTSAKSTPSYSSSRRGGYVSTNVQKRARTQSDNTLKAHSAYTARVKKEREAENRKAVKALEKYTGHKYKNNEEIKGTIYTGDPEQYKPYSISAKAEDDNADKTVYKKKSGTSQGVTLKEYYSQKEHKKEAQKAKKETEDFINNNPFMAGFGDAYSGLVGRGVEDYKDIFKNVKGKDGKKGLDTKKYDKSSAAKAGNVLGTVSQYVITGGTGGAYKAGASATAKALGKLAGKKAVKSVAKKAAKEAAKTTAKKGAKKLTKEGVKKFAKDRAAEVAADMPLDVAHSYKDSKGDTKEFIKQMGLNVGMNIGAGAGVAGIGKTLKAVKAKSALKKATNQRKETAKAVKKTLDVLDKRAKDQGDYPSDLRTKMGVKENPTTKVSKGKSVKQVILKDKRTGKVLAKGTPKTKLEKQTMIKAAMRKAGGIDNVKAETGWENTKPLTKGEADKIPTRPLKDSEIEEGARGVEKELDNTPVNGTADYNKGLKSYKKSKVRKEKVKDLFPSNHELNGNTKEISKTIDDDISEIIARRNAGDMQGAESLENDLAHRLADEDKQIYDKSLDTGDFRTFKEYVSNKPFYPPEGMTVKEAQEMFGSRNPEAKGVIKFVKRNGKRKGREIDVLAEELDGMFPGVLKDKGNTEDILGDIREYLEGGYKKDFSLMGELSGKELDDLVNMKRADIQSAIRDIENDINIKAKEPVVAKAEEPKPKNKSAKDMTFEEATAARNKGEISEWDYLRNEQKDLYDRGVISKEQYDAGNRSLNDTERIRHTDYRRWQREGKEVPEEYKEDYERYISEAKPLSVKEIDSEIKFLEKRQSSMSARTYDERMSSLKAERKEAKAREAVDAKKLQDQKDAKRIMRKPAKDRTPDEVKKILDDKENAPMAQAKTRLERSKTEYNKEFFHKAKTNLQKAFTDAGAEFENMARETIKAAKKSGDKKLQKLGEEVYNSVNSLRQTEKSVQYQLFDAQTDLNYKRIGDSVYDIVTPLKTRGKKLGVGDEVFADAQDILFHQHNVERVGEGKPVFGEGVSGMDSQKAIKDIWKKYESDPETTKLLKKVVGDSEAKAGSKEYLGSIRQYFKNLKQMRVDAGLMSKDVSDYLDELYPNYVMTKRSGDFTQGVESGHNVIGAAASKKATGSSRDLLSIEDQMQRATNEVWRSAKNNDLITKVVKMQGGTGEELGKDVDLDQVIADSLFADEVNGAYKLRFFEDGEAKTIDCSKEVYDSLKALNGQGWNPPEYAKRILDMTTGRANSIFKKLCTEWNPFFALYRNPMRDIQDALMYSKDFKGFVAHMPVAIKRMAKKDEYWQLWKASGGTQSSLFDITNQIRKSKNPIRRIGLMNQAVEQYPRFTEFCSILDKELKGAPVSSATKEMIDKASQAGADITVNFGRSGDITKILNRYAVPFLNPGVQGVSKAVRLVTERSGARAWIGLATKAAVLGFTPSVINEALLHDDKGYQQMNARDKITNYIIKVGDNYIKIPKGRLLSLIGMGGLKAVNTFTGGDKYTRDEMLDTAMNQSAPANPLNDNLFMTAINAANNKTWYGGNIQGVNENIRDVDQTTVYDANTTELAKWLSKTDFMKTIEGKDYVGLSPKKIDAMIKGYTGVLGELAMPLMTQKSKGAGLTGQLKSLAKETFTTDPLYQNEISSKFYENKATASREGTKKQQDYFDDQYNRVKAINGIIKDVQGSKRSYKEKNDLVDKLTKRRNTIMDRANKGVKMASDYKMRDMDAIAGIMGKKYALDATVTNKTDKDARKACGDDKTFYKGYKAIQGMGATSKSAKSVALVSSGADKKVFDAYGISDDDRKRAKDYFRNGGSTEEYNKASEITKGSGNDYMLKAMKLAKSNAPDRLYAVNDIYQSKMDAARVLAKSGMKASQFKGMKKKVDTDGNGYLKKEEVTNYVNKQKLSSNEKKALYSALAYANWNNDYGTPTVPKENYKLKGVSNTSATESKPKKDKNLTPYHKDYWKSDGQIDYSSPEAKKFFKNFGKMMSDERMRVGGKLYRAALASKKGLNAPHGDKDYIPKEALEVVRIGDKRLDAEALKALKGGGLKRIIKEAKKLPKVKESEDNTAFDDSGSSSGGGGRGYYRRYGRGGRGGRGGSSGGGGLDFPELKTAKTPTIGTAKSKSVDWTPKMVSTKPGWTDAQIRKVFNALISQGLTREQAVSRIASLWNTRFG